jgi:hypothetical protein
MQFKSLTDLEEDLDRLLKIGEKGATTCREAPVLDKYPDSDDDSEPFLGRHLGLTIASTPQDWFVYWKGMEPSELLEYDSRLVAFTQELPFQEGKPLPPITEEGAGEIVIVDYSFRGEFSDSHVYMAPIDNHDDDDEPGLQYGAEAPADISEDERTADALQDDNEECRRIQRLGNARRAKRRRNTEARAQNPPYRRNLHGEFMAADDREYHTPSVNIAEAALLI